MERRRATRWTALAIGLGGIVAGEAAFAQTPNVMPEAIKGLDVVERLGAKLPLSTPFVDSGGTKTTLGEAVFNRGKPVLVMMVYFRCPLQCPFTLDRYQQRFNEITDLSIGTDYNVAVISFDPTDTTAKAAENKAYHLISYNRGEQPGKGWSWLTSSDASASRAVADALGFQYRYLEASNEYAHPTVLFACTPDGHVSRYLVGLDTSARDLKFALIDASAGKIGSSFDRNLLAWCFHFDPKNGQYSVAAFRVMRIGGAISALVVGGIILAMLGVERRRKRINAATISTTPNHQTKQPLTTDLSS